nr:BEN [Cotesia vestalis bracovirus]
MMKRNNNYRRAFYVVQFTELPFEGIDDYVCVPYTWLIRYNTIDQRAVVSYPKDEDPFNTRDRVKRKEKCNDEWRFYMASVKYKSDSYSDAEYWIATKNDYGALVEEELKTIDTEPNFPLNKKLRIANRNHSSKLNDNPRKPLPRISIKRPALPEPNKQLDGKRMKLDDAAQSSSAVLTNVNAEPGSSRQEQSIIAQDNQPMESTQTGTTASDSNGTASSSQQKDENLQESLPIQEQQESSIPSIDVDTPILVMDDDDEVQPTSIEEHQVPSNQVTLQFTEQPEPIREPQILVVPSREMTSNNQRSQEDDILNNEPTSHQLRNSPKISAQLYHQMNEARRLIPTQKPVKKKIRPINIARNLAIAEQNPLMDQTGSLLTRSVPDQQRYHTSSYQNQYLPTNQNNLEQDLPKKSAASNNYEQRSNLQAISMSTPSIGQNSIIPSNPFYQTSEFPQQRQSRPTQQDSQQQPQKPKIRIGISIKSKNNRREPVIQGVTKKAPPPILTKVLNSIRQALSTTHDKYLLNEQQFQGNHTERATVNENHLNKIDNTMPTDEWVEEETPSAHHGENLNSDTVSDHEGISDHEMSADEAPIERTNNFDGTGTLLEPGVRQSPEGRHTEVTANTSSSTQYQQSNDIVKKPPKKKHNSWRIVLPPEYDPHDTRWTLKYQTNLPGLVELMPQSGVYISYGDLIYCQQVSKDCKSLALRLLSAIFNRKALSVCLSMTERAQASDDVRSNIRPELDDHACSVLLNFVVEHGLQRGWNTDLQPILSILHNCSLSMTTVLRGNYRYY